MFDCTFSNPVTSVVCSFDGGEVENCSFPLEVGIDRFGTDNHTVVVTVVDVFGQSLFFELDFRLIERKNKFVRFSLLVILTNIIMYSHYHQHYLQ